MKTPTEEEYRLYTVMAKLSSTYNHSTKGPGKQCFRKGKGMLSLCTRPYWHDGPHVDEYYIQAKIVPTRDCIWYD